MSSAPLSAIYLSRDLGYVWIGASIVSLVGAGVAQKEGKWRGRTDILSWYHVSGFPSPPDLRTESLEFSLIGTNETQFTVIEVAIFTLGVLFAYLVLGYKDHRLIQPGPYIVSGNLKAVAGWITLAKTGVLKVLPAVFSSMAWAFCSRSA